VGHPAGGAGSHERKGEEDGRGRGVVGGGTGLSGVSISGGGSGKGGVLVMRGGAS